ncbi:hypothetical protein [Pedobacter changchengzhani]|nr:hypothetical protein [Pedobacter changchengzhani]
MKNQEIIDNPIQTKKDWVKPELLTEEIDITLSPLGTISSAS